VYEPDWNIESWTEPGELSVLRNYFKDWSSELQSLLDRIEEPIFKWALHDREPLDQWVDGSVALLGDACHPMVPFMAQGACQAIEDAAILARCLDLPQAASDIAGVLKIYEATRLPRASKLQARSFDNATTYHYPDGPEQQARDEFFASVRDSADDESSLAAMDSVYGYNPLTVGLVHSQ